MSIVVVMIQLYKKIIHRFNNTVVLKPPPLMFLIYFRDVMIYASTVDVNGLSTAMNILAEAAMRPVIEESDVTILLIKIILVLLLWLLLMMMVMVVVVRMKVMVLS